MVTFGHQVKIAKRQNRVTPIGLPYFRTVDCKNNIPPRPQSPPRHKAIDEQARSKSCPQPKSSEEKVAPEEVFPLYTAHTIYGRRRRPAHPSNLFVAGLGRKVTPGADPPSHFGVAK